MVPPAYMQKEAAIRRASADYPGVNDDSEGKRGAPGRDRQASPLQLQAKNQMMMNEGSDRMNAQSGAPKQYN